ncbi:redox-sensing transcriptional repressor Rex [Candidatus Epulonipiscium fishelsonii]|uniref:Redox-sensing transcriptional repressor Rex n=1 Tax=Candidatus Epulonipiscium fishelsonii TaxID=77094 RepID=A0ACC8XGP6_9FIRM|nr:redox-sensing transcriptional repressor Rex [Epulopiscium sp. SCG-B05WGA-EpuloA1]ONI42609.1 redox-sensing transcriptional repressor Rex [Epulopiscium sp. SCG-B11WGA-EpuloA1]
MKSEISMAVIRRLPRYYRYLGELLDEGVAKISSKELSNLMKVTASQIRQDLNNFGGFGQQGYGYNVEYLYLEIGKILGLNKINNMILIGAGNLGQALANYPAFRKRGFNLIGIFDKNPKIIGLQIGGLEVLDVDKLEQFIKQNEVDIAILTIPKNGTLEIATLLTNWGIKGLWNFSPTDLFIPNVQIENVNLSQSLMTLAYQIHNKNSSNS